MDKVLTKITKVTQNDPATNSYDGKNVVFTYTPFTISPSFCAMSVACDDTKTTAPTGSDTMLCTELAADSTGLKKATYTFGEDEYKTLKNGPGIHTITYNVKSVGSTAPELTVPFTMKL
jgi:hypothetical protein